MASVKGFIEAGTKYKTAASNPTITTKPSSIWFAEIADKLEVEMALSELTLDYNLNLVDDEPVMTEQEMAEMMEVSEVAERSCWDCECCAGSDLDKDGVEIPGKVLCCNIQKYNTLPETVNPICGKICEYFKAQGGADYEPIFTAFVKAEKANQAIAAEAQKPKYSDWDMMLKDDEIARLSQIIGQLESEIDYVCKLYGINWNLVREARDSENRKRQTPGSM